MQLNMFSFSREKRSTDTPLSPFRPDPQSLCLSKEIGKHVLRLDNNHIKLKDDTSKQITPENSLWIFYNVSWQTINISPVIFYGGLLLGKLTAENQLYLSTLP